MRAREPVCSWLYRLLPSVCHKPFQVYKQKTLLGKDSFTATPNQLRWDPFPVPTEPVDFVDGLRTICAAGSPAERHGVAIHVYLANRSMVQRSFYNSDGDFLIG